MNVEPIIYTTLKQDSQQRHTPKNNTKPKFGTNELQLTKKELKHQKLCKRQHKKVAEDFNDKVLSGSISPLPWRWISGVLGVTCLLLMAVTIAVAVFTANSSSEQPPLTVQQEAMESLCLEPCGHSCPKNWVWFRCSCYYFSKEELTWTESQRACSSLNSSLINMNREEMNFFSLKSFFWIGVYYDGAVKHWLWENNSILSSDMFYLSTRPLQHACLSYKSKEVYLVESCETKQTYICKNPLIYSINSRER